AGGRDLVRRPRGRPQQGGGGRPLSDILLLRRAVRRCGDRSAVRSLGVECGFGERHARPWRGCPGRFWNQGTGVSVMNERYRRGVEILHQLTGESAEHLTSRVAEIAPDFSRMTIEFPFGDLYARNALGLREREIAAIGALAARGDASP